METNNEMWQIPYNNRVLSLEEISTLAGEITEGYSERTIEAEPMARAVSNYLTGKKFSTTNYKGWSQFKSALNSLAVLSNVPAVSKAKVNTFILNELPNNYKSPIGIAMGIVPKRNYATHKKVSGKRAKARMNRKQ